MALAFEKPYNRALGSTPTAEVCSSFDVRMSVKIPLVSHTFYPTYVNPAPEGDLEVNNFILTMIVEGTGLDGAQTMELFIMKRRFFLDPY